MKRSHQDIHEKIIIKDEYNDDANSNNNTSSSDEDDDGPQPLSAISSIPIKSEEPIAKRRKQDRFEKLYLSRLPNAEMYEKSYMHKSQISHTIVSNSCDFIITGSTDGQVKFWKIMPKAIEFVKLFQAHLEPLVDMSLNIGERIFCTVSSDKMLKIFDIVSFDMICMIQLTFTPRCTAWMKYGGSNSSRQVCLVADAESPAIFAFDYESGSEAVASITKHTVPVLRMAYNAVDDVMISVDKRGIIEYWTSSEEDPTKFDIPGPDTVSFEFKVDTDLFDLCKKKAVPQGIDVSRNGKYFAITCQNGFIYVFRFRTGKIKCLFDESLEYFETQMRNGNNVAKDIDNVDLGRRLAVEKNFLESVRGGLGMNSRALFDESSSMLIIPSLVGIKIVSISTNRVLRVLGKIESTERFGSICVYQGAPKRDHQLQHALHGPDSTAVSRDHTEPESDVEPIVVAASFQKHRFYMFTSRMPDENDPNGRDVFNEKPSTETGVTEKVAAIEKVLAKQCTLHTNLGDITFRMFPEECPRTVENFQTHAQRGYYDRIIFHRVIKGFMVQTGDPKGDGTGGESIWGGEFEDEISKSLKHDRPFTVSMANAGPNTNGSQFFITTAATPWLDGKHTVFGRVIRGADVVTSIENAKVDKSDRPLEPIRIMSISVRFSES